jgi:hypothetical protein
MLILSAASSAGIPATAMIIISGMIITALVQSGDYLGVTGGTG